MAAGSALDFYFDFSSPYAYFASTAIDALAARHGREVHWKPVLLGVVFKTTGAAPLTMVPLKGDYSRLDFERTARFHQIDFHMPEKFPLPTQTAARAMLWIAGAAGERQAVNFAKAVFRAMFVDGIDISAPEAVLAIGRAAGIDAAALEAGMNSEAVREQLRTAVAQAMARGVFGTPFVIADGEPFWGFDRFPQIEQVLAQRPESREANQQSNTDNAPRNIKPAQAMVNEASARIRRYSVADVQGRLSDPNVQLVDLRDIRELEREGVVPGAFHAPRGMIEFWVDPASPYFKPVFGEKKEFIFFCAAGWRSALAAATVQDMGLGPVADIEGGFSAWKAAGAPVAEKTRKA